MNDADKLFMEGRKLLEQEKTNEAVKAFKDCLNSLDSYDTNNGHAKYSIDIAKFFIPSNYDIAYEFLINAYCYIKGQENLNPGLFYNTVTTFLSKTVKEENNLNNRIAFLETKLGKTLNKGARVDQRATYMAMMADLYASNQQLDKALEMLKLEMLKYTNTYNYSKFGQLVFAFAKLMIEEDRVDESHDFMFDIIKKLYKKNGDKVFIFVLKSVNDNLLRALEMSKYEKEFKKLENDLGWEQYVHIDEVRNCLKVCKWKIEINTKIKEMANTFIGNYNQKKNNDLEVLKALEIELQQREE